MDHNSCRNTGYNSGVWRFSPSNARWIAAASATNDEVSKNHNDIKEKKTNEYQVNTEHKLNKIHEG